MTPPSSSVMRRRSSSLLKRTTIEVYRVGPSWAARALCMAASRAICVVASLVRESEAGVCADAVSSDSTAMRNSILYFIEEAAE